MLLLGCSAESDFMSESNVKTKTRFLENDPVELSSVAYLLATMDIDIDLMEEVKQVVNHGHILLIQKSYTI